MYLLDSANVAELVSKSKAASQGNKSNTDPLCCAICTAPITDAGEAIEVMGRHRHVKQNPAGQQFNIGCYKTAPGCSNVGVPTLVHTWFAGCAWQFTHCIRCGTQLGWYFDGETAFFGLISEQLVPCDQQA